ncbi:MAG: PTS sugar transporter subunit IIB [Caldibacillus debilis]|mgnify:CR=1 FL=1|uniref:PTS sugar transporter subunit IIB n=1 Tax=Caldibacillus debilis TaxID=301148 RepID=A0A3E0K178_9BACI|nr:PTS sugar transporter subunit IIB [Caldibacillus debilis]OUM83683.1 MAG: PTS sugar transporter subunit IIB [Caldibacillus debilis]REJ26660.1 MAG: PTS sugar transporter subunit IIB [Caldibacillus debilis]REJ28440.1 MAG: PTS sugar transporter subunit IIB [Caldibacillus debilis]
MTKNVLFVCATGIATSTAVAEKVIEFCKEHGVTFHYKQINVAAVPANWEQADLIISTTNVPYQVNTPIVNGLPLITGIGEEKVLNEILTILKEDK